MAPATLDRPAPAVPRPRRVRRIAAAVAVAAVLGTEAVLVAPHLAGAASTLRNAADGWVGLAVLAAAGSLTAFALVRRRLLRAAGIAVSTRSTLAGILVANAFHMTLPGGVAFSTGYAFRWLRRHGADPTVAGWNLAVNGLLSTATLAALGVAASLLAGGTGWVRLGLEVVAVALAVAAVARVVRRPEPVLAAAARATRRPDPDAWVTGVAAQLRAVRPTPGDWTAATGAALLNWLLDLACLTACAAAVGLSGLSVAVLLTAYVAGMAASSLSLLPGGLGTVDAALVLGLVAGGAPATVALAAVVLYRLVSLVGVVAAGWAVHAAAFLPSSHPSLAAR